MTFDRFDFFEAYTNQTLPEPQRQALDQQLRQDASLREELLDYQHFKHSIDAVTLKQQLERLHTQLDQQGELVTDDRPAQRLVQPPRLRRQRMMPTVAALLVVLVGLSWYWFSRPSLSEETFQTYYQPDAPTRGKATCGPELIPGIDAYRARKYAQALEQFERVPTSQPCVRYYVGVAQLALGHTAEARTALESARQPGPDVPVLIRQKAEWYLALTYLKADRPADAQRQLAAITEQPIHPFRNVAQRALVALHHE